MDVGDRTRNAMQARGREEHWERKMTANNDAVLINEFQNE